MKIKADKPTVAFTEGDLVAETHSLDIETRAGTLRLVDLMGGGIAVSASDGTAIVRASGAGTLIVEVSK